MNAFIDTNILLAFYSFDKEYLEKLIKVLDLAKDKKITIYLTEQVIDEFNKNREERLKKGLELIKEMMNPKKVSLSSKDFSQMREIDVNINRIEELSKQLEKEINKRIEDETLPSDIIIHDIFLKSNIIDFKKYPTVIRQAKIRHYRGMPPGSSSYIGDEINWEFLLCGCPQGEDLYLITADTDYCSDIDKSKIHPFLRKEWELLKHSKIHYYYGSISKFLNDQFSAKIPENVIQQEIQASGQIQKEIKYYQSSPSFLIPMLAGITYAPTQDTWTTPSGDVYAFDEFGRPIQLKKSQWPWSSNKVE